MEKKFMSEKLFPLKMKLGFRNGNAFRLNLGFIKDNWIFFYGVGKGEKNRKKKLPGRIR
jgi:hypothetical protein